MWPRILSEKALATFLRGLPGSAYSHNEQKRVAADTMDGVSNRSGLQYGPLGDLLSTFDLFRENIGHVFKVQWEVVST